MRCKILKLSLTFSSVLKRVTGYHNFLPLPTSKKKNIRMPFLLFELTFSFNSSIFSFTKNLRLNHNPTIAFHSHFFRSLNKFFASSAFLYLLQTLQRESASPDPSNKSVVQMFVEYDILQGRWRLSLGDF